MGVMSDPLTTDLFPQAVLPVMLRGPADLEGFRHAARGLLAQHILPAQVSWHTQETETTDHNLPAAFSPDSAAPDAPAIQVPPEFVTVCESAILHSDPRRFDLLYRLLWRLVHEPALRHDPLDADMAEAQQLAHAVRRDMHKMKAFTRFHTVQDDTFRNDPEGGPLHVGWFEPEHHIVEAVAPVFARRFAQMRWAVLTPEASVQWDGAQLQFGPGASKEDAPAPDADGQAWLAYYRHIFKPARLTVPMLQKPMPRKYRRKLPGAEGAHPPLVSAVHQRGGRIAAQPARRTPPARAELAIPTPAPAEAMQVQLPFNGLHQTSMAREATKTKETTKANQDHTPAEFSLEQATLGAGAAMPVMALPLCYFFDS
jgi:probable DNA metabolism protein